VAKRIKPPRKMSPVGAPVFARLSVVERGCVSPPGSDGVVAPPRGLVVVASEVVVLSDVMLGVVVLGVVVLGVVVLVVVLVMEVAGVVVVVDVEVW
jgi:hypothetical protein